MLNIEAFRELCRRASIEKDPAQLATIKEALRFMLHSEGIQLCRVQWLATQKPN
jgi:hypothetical protein